MEDKYIKLSDAKNALADYIAEQTVSKYGYLEACREARFGVEGAMKELDYVPTADVVPKSEVERLQKALDEYEETSGLKQAKAEVAMEIFEEIEKTVFADMDFFKELKKKYTEGKT